MLKNKKAFIPLILLITLFFILGVRFIIDLTKPKQLCNGHEKLCDKKLNHVVFATNHNAMGIADYGWFGPTQNHSITSQLEGGVRAFMIDTHYYDAASSIESYIPNASELEKLAVERIIGKTKLETKPGTYSCHIICQLGSTPLSQLLSEIKLFLDANPNEVVVLLIEDKITVTDTQKAFEDSQIIDYVYDKSPNIWPTLKELIVQNKRLVVMAEVEGPPPVWYHNMWNYVEETPYGFKTADEMNCSPNRGGTDKPFFLVNNWIERVISRESDAEMVNDYDFLINRVKQCEKERGKKVNFVAVNFYEFGDTIEVVKTLNGVK